MSSGAEVVGRWDSSGQGMLFDAFLEHERFKTTPIKSETANGAEQETAPNLPRKLGETALIGPNQPETELESVA